MNLYALVTLLISLTLAAEPAKPPADAARASGDGASRATVKAAPSSDVEVEATQPVGPVPLHQGSINPNAGSQMGVELRFRPSGAKRATPSRAAPDRPDERSK